MKSKKLLLFLPVLAMVLLNLACGFSASTANVKEAQLAKDEAGTQATTAFGSGDTFYFNVTLANAPEDTKVKAAWTAVQVEGADANTALDSTEMQSGDGVVHFKLTNNTPWPAGKYKVDLFLNDKLDRTVEFQVQ